MIEYLFILNEGLSDELEIDEPYGFADIQLSIIRGERHGVGQEASTTTLNFSNAAYNYIIDKYESDGIKAKVIFTAYTRCNGPYSTFDLLVSGRLNFGQLKKTCGSGCTVTLPIEKDSCELVLNSRLDQQVDVDGTTGVDGMAALARYDEMGQEIQLEAVRLLVADEAKNSTDNTEVISDQPTWPLTRFGNGLGSGWIAPKLDVILSSSLGNIDTSSFSALTIFGTNIVPPPEFPITVDTGNFTGNIKCNFSDIQINYRLKGNSSLTGGTPIDLYLLILKLPAGQDKFSPWVTLLNEPFSAGTTFDYTGNISIPLIQGDEIVYGVRYFTDNFDDIDSFSFNLDKETFFKAESAAICEPSQVQYYMLHELLSHVTEQITNGCLRVKSSYYGRTDSQPYNFINNGCGAYRFATSGLKIRRAPEAKFFASLKQLIDGLNAIDNIGINVVGNDLIIESVRYFYQDIEVLKCPYISTASEAVDEAGHYAKILAGYKNWKVQKINGLDEFNSEREYKTAFDTISNTLDIQSELVTGSYPIEVTRQQSFADTGAADTTYDNNIFLICVKREPSPYSGFDVEQGGVTDPENMFSPETVYNWRLRPVANMLRWYKTIASGYRKVMDSANKIFFSSGTGNILAKGLQTDLQCRIETFTTIENQNIEYTQTADYLPIWLNELITFDYPLSLSDYNKIKATPYGYISYQCGTGEWRKGFIKEIKYRLNKGTATFILKRKYGA